MVAVGKGLQRAAPSSGSEMQPLPTLGQEGETILLTLQFPTATCQELNSRKPEGVGAWFMHA